MHKPFTILLTFFLCCVFSSTTIAQSSEIVRNPYLQSATSSSIVIKWRTSKATDSKVWYGENPSQLLQTVEVNTITNDHEVTISNLEQNKTYYYAVGDGNRLLVGNDAQHYFTTAPTTGTEKATIAWILGDPGTATSAQRQVRDAYYDYIGNKHTDMILLLGDNAYNDGTDAQYQQAFFDIYEDKLKNTHVWSAPGNHDYYDKGGLNADYYDIFTFPTGGEAGGLASNTEKYYAFDYGKIHFISLDSQDEDRDSGSPMLTWLENDLATTNQEWIVVIFHHPPYSKGSHDSDRERTLIEMRENVVPLLDDYGVDLVLSGHSHSYERTKLIQGHYGTSNTFDSNLHAVDNGDGQIDGDGAYQKNASGEGVVYIVTGSAGKRSSMRGEHAAMHYSVSRLGSTILELEDSIMHIKFLNESGIIEDNFLLDKKNSDPDNDNDGVPASRDCDDNDANLTIVGAACNDGNFNTENDVITADCGCAGTVAPDLFPNFTFSNTSYTEGQARFVIININEIVGGTTQGRIQFFVPKSAGFTYDFNPNLTNVSVFATELVDNGNWSLTDTGTGFLFSSNVPIAANSRSRIALRITGNAAGTTANLTVNVVQGSGGEDSFNNNIAVLAQSL